MFSYTPRPDSDIVTAGLFASHPSGIESNETAKYVGERLSLIKGTFPLGTRVPLFKHPGSHPKTWDRHPGFI